MFKAVLFDLWETLINDRPERAQPRRVWRSSAVRDVLRRHGCEAAMEAIQAALDASSSALSRLHDAGKDLGAGGRARLFVTLLEEHSGPRAPEAAILDLEDIITSMPLDIAPLAAPNAVETAAAIKQRGMATALVCNAGFTTTPHLLPMLSHYGLSQHLDVMVFSDVMGIAKPDARIFAKALEGIGMAPAECAFVGDNPHTDIAGAQAVGLFAVQVGSKQRDGVVPHVRIDDLSQLLTVLDEYS
jgi:putative hydrolase of the HAD superfamily